MNESSRGAAEAAREAAEQGLPESDLWRAGANKLADFFRKAADEPGRHPHETFALRQAALHVDEMREWIESAYDDRKVSP